MDTEKNPMSTGRKIGRIIGTVFLVLLVLMIAADVEQFVRNRQEFFSRPYSLQILFVEFALLASISWLIHLPKSAGNKAEEEQEQSNNNEEEKQEQGNNVEKNKRFEDPYF